MPAGGNHVTTGCPTAVGVPKVFTTLVIVEVTYHHHAMPNIIRTTTIATITSIASMALLVGGTWGWY